MTDHDAGHLGLSSRRNYINEDEGGFRRIPTSTALWVLLCMLIDVRTIIRPTGLLFNCPLTPMGHRASGSAEDSGKNILD